MTHIEEVKVGVVYAFRKKGEQLWHYRRRTHMPPVSHEAPQDDIERRPLTDAERNGSVTHL